jgi:hypothetical protein
MAMALLTREFQLTLLMQESKNAKAEGEIFLTVVLVVKGFMRDLGDRKTPQWSDLPKGGRS